MGGESSKPSENSEPPVTVKVFCITTGQTYGADQTILEHLNKSRSLKVETTTDLQECDVILVFCPIKSRVGSDVEAAMTQVPGGKPVVLVLMHHTGDVDYSTDVKRWSEDYQNVVLDVNVLFHETLQGLLTCPINDEAVRKIQGKLKRGYRVECCSQRTCITINKMINMGGTEIHTQMKPVNSKKVKMEQKQGGDGGASPSGQQEKPLDGKRGTKDQESEPMQQAHQQLQHPQFQLQQLQQPQQAQQPQQLQQPQSHPQPKPPPSPTFREPWRKIPWGDKHTLKVVEEYKPGNDNINHLRILLYGPVGAGKSSFISSVSSVVRGRMCIGAEAAATTSNRSFTRRYQTHRIRKGTGNPKTFYPFVFNDIMGLENGPKAGVLPEDIKLAMKGHVKDGYKFDPVSPLSEDDPWYNPDHSADDRVHLLVCVLSANLAEITDSILEKIKDVRDAASELGIPEMMIVTHIDTACAETEKDLKNVYKSKYLKKKMKEFSSAVGFPENCIFPVKNYSDEIDLDPDVDALILNALRTMLDFGHEFINKMEQ